MLRTALAAVIGATIVVGALAGCDNSAASAPTIQAPAAQPHQFTTPAVAPAPLPDIQAIAERATAQREAERAATAEVAASAKMPAECIGYGCSDAQDAEINEGERAANAGESQLANEIRDIGMSGTGDNGDEDGHHWACRTQQITEGC